MLTVLLVTVIVFTGEGIFVSSQNTSISNTISIDQLQKCQSYMIEADSAKDNGINSTEYLSLLKIWTNGKAVVDSFNDMDIRFVFLYHLTSCKCIEEPGSSYDCCYGPNSKISFIPNNPNPHPNVVEFCLEMNQLVMEIYNPPTSPPTASPDSPTMAPTVSPATPTKAPSSQAPTAAPTVDKCYKVTYHFNLVNDLGLDAHAIDNAINNTLKADLLNATRFSVVNTLNSTYPRATGLSKGHMGTNIFMSRSDQNARHTDDANNAEGSRRSMLRNISDNRADSITSPERNNLRLKRSDSNSRRLVYFTEKIPIRVDWIADNPFCPSNSNSKCILLKFDICIVLEEGDVAIDIRKKIIADLQSELTKYLVNY